jgi:hypothetical protein
VTRAYAGLLAFDVALLCAGGCVLYGIGLVRDARSALRLAGLAFVVGWATFGVLASLALAAGLAVTVGEALAICALIAGAGFLLGRRVPPAAPTRPHRSAPWARRLAWGAGAMLACYLVALLVKAFVAPADTFWDTWAFWLPKAKAIYFFGGLDTRQGAFASFASPDYPPLLPGMDSTAFHFMGGIHAAALPLQAWVLVSAFFAGAGALLVRRVSPALVWPSLAMIAFMPRAGYYLLSAFADEPLAILLGLSAVCAALWLLDDDPRYAGLCGVFLAGATMLKNEGFLFGLFLTLVLGAVVVFQNRRRWRPAAALVLVPLLTIVPWKIWLATHGQPTSSPYYKFSNLAHPGYLADRAGRLERALSDLPQYLFAPHRWALVVPLALAAAALAFRTRSGLAVLLVGWLAVALLGLATVYWISPVPIGWYIATSAERVVLSMVVVCGLLFPLLLSQASSSREEGVRSTGNVRKRSSGRSQLVGGGG